MCVCVCVLKVKFNYIKSYENKTTHCVKSKVKIKRTMMTYIIASSDVTRHFKAFYFINILMVFKIASIVYYFETAVMVYGHKLLPII